MSAQCENFGPELPSVLPSLQKLIGTYKRPGAYRIVRLCTAPKFAAKKYPACAGPQFRFPRVQPERPPTAEPERLLACFGSPVQSRATERQQLIDSEPC